MNTPGVSLFQGADLKVNTSLDLEAEEEALADQRRREEELGNLLQNAFDDLEDDETTVDSTTNFQSDLIEQPHNNDNNNNNDAAQQERQCQLHMVEIHKLQMHLEARTNELENIRQMCNTENKRNDELQKRLIITEAELDRALTAKKNTHELLVESKEKCSNLENTIGKLRGEKKELETENIKLVGQLETSQTLLSDVQRKYDMVERDLNKHNERNAELRRKQLEERHRGEMEVLQLQLEQLSNKLERKTTEVETMTARYNALQASHENMLVEKASTINDLNNALGVAQSKCEELLSKQDYHQENMRLQKLVVRLQEQIAGMEKTITSLNERLEYTTNELDVLDSVLHQCNLEGTPRRLSQTQGRFVGSTPLNVIDRMGNLKDELQRALANVKSKREEVRRLQQSLDEKQTEVRTLREEENKSLVLVATLKEDKLRLENRVKVLEEEYETMRRNVLNNSEDNRKLNTLTEELKQLREEKMRVEAQRNDLERKRETYELERRQLDAQLKNVEVDLEELKQEHESMKRNYEQILEENQNLRSRTTADNVRLDLAKHKFLLKDAQTECDRLKTLYVEISNAKEALGYELEKLRSTDSVKELQEQRDKVANMQRALQLAEVKCSELSKILETEKLCHEREVNALREKCDKEKTDMVKLAKDTSNNNCSKCIDYMAEITKFEIQNLKLSNVNAISKKEIDELTDELQKSKSLVTELTDKLRLSEQQEQLIKELKSKAQQFEEYIRSRSNSAAATTSNSPTSPKQQPSQSDKSVTTSPEMNRAQIRNIETRVRDEMAKIFAAEIKRYQQKLHQTEEKCHCMQRELEHVGAELQQRQVEVDLLKQAILADRENMQEVLNEKDTEHTKLLEKQNVMLRKCRDELQSKSKRISELVKELDERQLQIEAERKSMKAVMSQWEKQRRSAEMIESEWKEKLQELQKTHDVTIASWQKKYNSAKRTIENYKRYAEDQEAHMRKEYERIKMEYDSSLSKIEIRMREVLEKKNQEMKDTLAAIEKRRELNGADKENKAHN